ncbi:Obp9NTE, partial [Eciton burchellii]
RADVKRICRQETKVSWASLKRLKAGNIDHHDMKLKCYLRCFMMKNDILDENNNMNIDKILRYLPDHMKERTKNILNRCKSVKAENACDKAFQIAICYAKEQPEILKSTAFI